MLESVVLILGSLLLLLIICKRYPEYAGILTLALIARLLILFVDINHVFKIINSGADTEAFHAIAIFNQTAISWNELTNYTNFLTIVYFFTDCSRVIAQFINVVLGIGVLFTVISSLELLDIPKKIIRRCVIILALMPNAIIFSAILLREAWVELFVALSVLQFIRWYRFGGIINMLFTFAFVLIASYMHAGAIGFAIGYSFGFITYNRQKHRIVLTFRSIISLSIIIAIGVYALTAGLFIDKFESYDVSDANQFMHQASLSGDGSAAYLTWLPPATSVWSALLYAPLRMMYFFCSPVPFDWRGVNDMIAFGIDACLYIFCIISIVRYKPIKQLKLFKLYLLIAIITAGFIYSYGTQNAGTAMRHRAKFIAPLCIAYSISNKRFNSFTISKV